MQSNQLLRMIKQDAVELCSTMGLMLKKTVDPNDPAYVHMPFSIFPTPFPAESFAQSLDFQPYLGQAVAGIVRDPQHNIYPVLHGISLLDDFLKRMLEVSAEFNARKSAGLPVQNTHMCILRSDYMIDWPDLTQAPQLKLVEYNTVAVSLLPVSHRVKLLQRNINLKYKDDLPFNYVNDFDHYLNTDPAFSANPILQEGYSQFDEMVAAFARALELYKETVPGTGKAWVLFVVETQERNVVD